MGVKILVETEGKTILKRDDETDYTVVFHHPLGSADRTLKIPFQSQALENGINGITNEDLLMILRDRLQHQNGLRHSYHNDRVLGYIKESLAQLDIRHAAVKRQIEWEEKGGRIYITSDGETLLGIAQRELGDEGRWEDIVELNPELTHTSPHEYLLSSHDLLMPLK